ncbi:MAG: ACP S-malonyltransferase [Desulfovibrio sp.]|jgi:[acyl-carrier-protein] S-malonyltransferase|nr:ACP S-malonyltransferase [Desulfovibrio sp.]
MSDAILFPGQGAQKSGMGRDAAERDKEIMDLWKKAERISRLPLRDIYWGNDGPETAATLHVQPALTTLNLALWMRAAGTVRPAAAAGHSLGEFSAVAAAGVLPFDRVLELVSLRGKLMQEADGEGKGAMAAVVKLDRAQAELCIAEAARVTGQTILIANYNTPEQFTASGTRAAVSALQSIVREKKGRALPLAVTGAFHSPLMRDAAEEFAGVLDAVSATSWSTARFPVYCNVAPEPLTDPMRIKELMKRQMTSPVYWTDCIRRQWDAGCRVFIEYGPGAVLSKMVGPILAGYAGEAGRGAGAAPWKSITVSEPDGLKNIPQQLDTPPADFR